MSPVHAKPPTAPVKVALAAGYQEHQAQESVRNCNSCEHTAHDTDSQQG
jgi:hypothetical protein